MVATSLSLLLFFFWCALGNAVLTLLYTKRNLLQTMLLAPVVGAATNLLPIFWLSRAGLPVKSFAVGLATALLLVTGGLILWLHPRIPLRRCWFIPAVLLLSFFLTGRPMLEFGFGWISYSNSDMTNFTLGAHRLLEHGYFDPPDLARFVENQEPSLKYWFWAPLGIRTGSELMLAWVVGITRLNEHQVFMPLILALHLVLITSVSALVCFSNRLRLAAYLTALLIGLSALSTLGVLLQLIAQVFGLSLLAGISAVLLRIFRNQPFKFLLRHSILAAILVSAAFIVYPEIVPFVLLSIGVYWAFEKRDMQNPLPVPFYLATGVISCFFLNTYIANAIDFLRDQMNVPQASADVAVSLFPYFLIPSGLSDFWGLSAVPGRLTEPWMSLGIVAGACLLVLAIMATIWLTRKSKPIAVVTAVMFSLSFYLFVRRVDFGLFKMAMFIQPFVCGTLVTAWLRLTASASLVNRSPNSLAIAVVPLVLLGLLGAKSQATYVEQSRGFGFTEIRAASLNKVTEQIKGVVDHVRSPVIVLDTFSDVIAKLFSLYTQDKMLFTPAKKYYPTPSREYYVNALAGHMVSSRQEDFLFWTKTVGDNFRAYGLNLIDESEKGWAHAKFDLKNGPRADSYNEFQVAVRATPPGVPASNVTVVTATSDISVLNRGSRSSNASDGVTSFYAQRWDEVRNHLMFIHSQRGQQYFLADRRRVALFPTEADAFYEGSTMSGVGRHLLFQVINPSEGVRMILDLTDSLKGDGENKLPPAAVIGSQRYAFPLAGRGSARVVSPPLVPQTIAGRPFLAIDMGIDGKPFADSRVGLMKLYGQDVPRDYRHVVAFVRSISLVDPEEYQRMSPPTQLAAFPADLATRGLEYSGVYEDGWVSEDALLQLSQPQGATTLLIRGQVPLVGDPSFRTDVRLIVDGVELAHRNLRPGDFELRVEVPANGGRREIRLQFSNLQRLTPPDDRPAAAFLRFVGFKSQ